MARSHSKRRAGHCNHGSWCSVCTRRGTALGMKVLGWKALPSDTCREGKLAKAAGVSQGNLGELEWDGESSMAVVRLATACGVRAEWLAEGVGEMVEATEWPFSDELLRRVLRLDSEGLQKAEKVLRAHIGLQPGRTAPLLPLRGVGRQGATLRDRRAIPCLTRAIQDAAARRTVRRPASPRTRKALARAVHGWNGAFPLAASRSHPDASRPLTVYATCAPPRRRFAWNRQSGAAGKASAPYRMATNKKAPWGRGS
jgi:hypothetical protein